MTTSLTGRKAMLAERRRMHRERVANCNHRYDSPRWAGILGWRYDCSKCGDMFVPHLHEDCERCELHPSTEERQ